MQAKETTGTGLPIPRIPLSLGQAGTLVTEVCVSSTSRLHLLC